MNMRKRKTIPPDPGLLKNSFVLLKVKLVWSTCGKSSQTLTPQDKKEVQEWSVRKSYLQIRRTKLNKGTTAKRLALRHFGWTILLYCSVRVKRKVLKVPTASAFLWGLKSLSRSCKTDARSLHPIGERGAGGCFEKLFGHLTYDESGLTCSSFFPTFLWFSGKGRAWISVVSSSCKLPRGTSFSLGTRRRGGRKNCFLN